MKFRVFGLLALVVALFSGCVKDGYGPYGTGAVPPGGTERAGKDDCLFDRTVILYCEGFNNLKNDILDNISLLEAGYLPEKWSDRALVVYEHFPKKYGDYKTLTEPLVYRLYKHYGEIVRDTILTYPAERGSATGTFMRKVLTDISRELPSRSWGMIYSSHGTGWMPGDYKKSDEPGTSLFSIGAEFGGQYTGGLEISDFREAMPFPFEFMIMDACLMGGVEVVYEWKDVCRYLVASPGEILAAGMNYAHLGSRLLEGEQADLEGVCEDYMELYKGQYATIALYDCAKVTSLVEPCRTVFEKYRSAISGLDPDKVQGFNYNFDVHFDFRDILVKAGAGDEELAGIDAALGSLVLYKASTPTFFGHPINTYCGLSMFLPSMERWPVLSGRYASNSWNQATNYCNDQE